MDRDSELSWAKPEHWSSNLRASYRCEYWRAKRDRYLSCNTKTQWRINDNVFAIYAGNVQSEWVPGFLCDRHYRELITRTPELDALHELQEEISVYKFGTVIPWVRLLPEQE